MPYITDPDAINANSYVTLDQADDYFNASFQCEQWFDYSPTQKEGLLAQSTRRIDTIIFDGTKVNNQRNLQWPRSGIVDRDGASVTGLPINLIYATCEMAKWIWTESERFGSDITIGQVDSYNLGGDVQVTFKKGATTFPPTVSDALNSIAPGVVISGAGKSTSTVSFTR